MWSNIFVIEKFPTEIPCNKITNELYTGKQKNIYIFFFTVHGLLLNCQSKNCFQATTATVFRIYLNMQSFEKIQDRNESCYCPAAILDSDFPATRFPQCPCQVQLLKFYTPLRPCFWFTRRRWEFGGSAGRLVIDRQINPLTALSGKRRYCSSICFSYP